MTRLKQLGLYVLLTAALGLLLWMMFPSFWEDCVASALTGQQTIQYTRAAGNSSGTVYAVGRQGNSWRLIRGDERGRQASQSLAGLGIDNVVSVSQLHACANGGAVLTVYEEKDALLCRAYYIAPGGREAQLLFSAPCQGGTTKDVRLFGFAEEGGAVAFFLEQEGDLGAYTFTPGEEGLEKVAALTAEQGARALYALPDGTVALLTGDGAMEVGAARVSLPAGVSPVAGWPVKGGACLLDGGAGALWYLDTDSGRAERLTVLETDVIDLSVSANGQVLLLADGGTMWLWSDGAARDQTGLLHRQQWQSVLLVALGVAGVLLMSLTLWYALWELRKMQLSLMVRYGAAIAVVLALLTAGAARWIVEPHYEAQGEALAKTYLSAAARAVSEEGADQEQLASFLRSVMGNAEGDCMTLVKRGGVLYRDTPEGERTSLSALLLGGAFRQAAETALESGTAFVRYRAGETDCYAAIVRGGENRLTVISAPCAAYLADVEQGAAATVRLLWIAAGVVLALMLLALAALSGGLRRVTKGMTAIQNGAYVEVVDQGGDEVSAMADSLNTLSQAMRDADAQELRRREVYARFLPNRITDLLGVSSVESIDKQTFASRNMATMHVSFLFDEQVYESRSKEIFDNINEVTERTARIVSAQGGMILSFSHEGFDALFDLGDSAPVSAAVAVRQEAISINRERSRRGLSPVTLRVTLDSGEVLLGVVGDEKRMQATAVSSSFSTARLLDALFTRFDANILCTERMERWIGEYGSRYIGKAQDGAALLRVYEIYDGDPYLVRQGKAEAARAFSEGVYTLYAGDYAAAKRIFMEVVRHNSGDGAARYYLYLADRFEKEPPAEVCLSC